MFFFCAKKDLRLLKKTQDFQKNPCFFCAKKDLRLSKDPRLFKNPCFLCKKRLKSFQKTQDFSKNPRLFKTIKRESIILLFLPEIMATNTLGEFSDGEDDFVFEIDEGVWRNLEEDDDDVIRSIDEDEVLNQIQPVQSDENVWNNSEEDDDLIRSINEDEVLNQMGRGEKRKSDDQDEEPQQDYYQIKPVRKHHSQKFNMTAKNYSVHFNNVLDDVNLLESRNRTYGIFDHLLKDVTQGMNSTDQVRFVLSSNQLQFPISLPFCPLEELTTEKVLSHVEKVVQSNEEFRLNTTVNIDVIHVAMPQGSGRRKRTTLNIRDHLKKKKSIITINNKDDLCLARALAVSIARIEKDPRYNSILDSRCTVQRERAFDLHEAANVPLGPCGLKEVDLFQHYLTNYEIIVVSGDQDNTIIYPPRPRANPNPEKSIYLYYQANHFDVITKLPGFFNTSYFCHACYKGYDHTTDHLCDGMCYSCRGFGCTIEDNGITCQECDRLFKNQTCYDRHKQEPINGGGRTVCETVKKCPTCHNSMDVRKLNNHPCVDKKKCPTCKIERNPSDLNHKCYMQQEGPKEEPSYSQLLFFDFECTQEHGIHEVNLCVVYDEEGEVAVFRGKNAVKDFCNWLLTPEHQDSIVIAHNFQGYDSYPIIKYLHANTIGCEAIYNGAKCVTLKTKTKKSHQFKIRIKFIDSLNFIPMALAKFPKTFGQDELCKGYFPHFFNKDENQEYVGPIPCQDDYGVNYKKPAEREKFMTWHQEQVENNYVFDFQHEILKYCRSDVDILAQCCRLYREMFKKATDTANDETGIDPFDTATTIAGYCMQVYRTKFLQKDTIALLPQHQQLKRKQSHEALQWLSYTAEKEEIRIQHARNGGEKRVGKYYLDGYCEETHTAYEYQGCYWHGKVYFVGCGLGSLHFIHVSLFFLGCPECYPMRNTMNPGADNKPMEELYQDTQKKIKYLKDQGFEVVEKWGCAFKKELEQDEEMKQFVKDHGFVEPLQPRDAFFGGRTNAAKLLHECQGNEKIK